MLAPLLRKAPCSYKLSPVSLRYTHSVLQREEGLQREAGPQCMYSAHAVEKANELANVEKSIYEHRDLLRQICSYHHRPRRDPHAVTCQKCMSECLSECEALLDKYDKFANPFTYGDKGGKEEGAPGDVNNAEGEEDEEDETVKRRPSYTPQLIKAKSAKCFDKRLKTLQELCDDTFYKATVELLKVTERSFRGELSYLHTCRLDRVLRKKQRVTNFLFEEDLGDDEEDERGTLRSFCAVNHAVDNCALLNLPPIVIGPEPLEGRRPSDPLDPASETSRAQELCEFGLVDGHLESSPSDQTLETQESSEETKGSFSSDKSKMGQTDKQQNLASGKTEATDSDLTPDHNTDLERESSSEEIETTAGEDEGDQTPVSLLEVISELEASREDGCDGVTDGTYELESDLLVPLDTACCMAQDGFLYEASAPENLDQGSHPQPCQNTVVNQEPQALLPLPDDYTVGTPCSENAADGLELPVGLHGDAVSRTSAEDGSDCTMSVSTGSDRAASPLGYGRLVTLRQRKKAGQGALRFVRQYPFAMQALWCLLSGRTLVVLGADEGRVRRLVGALALFVPGPGKCRERVQAWLSCPFTLTDLQRWKLIGLQRYFTYSEMFSAFNTHSVKFDNDGMFLLVVCITPY